MASPGSEQLRFMELCKLHNISAALDDGDTLVFIDYPLSPRHGRPNVDCYGERYESQSFRVHSDKLRATGSSKFLEMFHSDDQCRVRRRRKLMEGLPDGVKYVLDLTPPSEGEDLVFQVATMSLTPGIMGWWRQTKLSSVDPGLVNGHDDVCSCGNQVATDKAEDEQLRNVPDYCPIRHRNSIVRILMLIEGRDIVLDSANRVWSLVAAAKILDCSSVIRDPVAQWIMYGQNIAFIEILPEEALQIGFDLELVQVTQFAFRILVSELAIKLAATSLPDHTHDRDASRSTIFGRRTGTLDDELSNMVQHAARVLVERTQSLLDDLMDLNKPDIDLGDEWTAIKEMEQALALEDSGDEDYLLALMRLRVLVDGVPRAFVLAIDRAPVWPSNTSIDVQRRKYIPQSELTPLSEIFESFNTVQKIMCPFIWTEIDWTWCRDGLLSIEYRGVVEDFANHLQRYMASRPSTAVSPALKEAVRKAMDTSTLDPSGHLISLVALDDAIRPALRSIILNESQDTEPLTITRHLLPTLTSEEMSFLPMWAGGCDDGTGGVFGSTLPPADMGPVAPGPGYHTGRGLTVSTASTAESLVAGVAEMEVYEGTVGRSLDVQDSADETRMTESFVTDGSEYRDAVRRFDRVTLGLAEDQEADWEVDLGDSDRESVSTVMADLSFHSAGDVDVMGGDASEDSGMSDDGSMVLV